MYLKKELYELIQSDESIFDFIQECSLDGLWYWDIENPENEWMNARFWTVLGYNPDEMPHKSSAWKSIINQEDLKVANENFVKHCENPNHPYDQIVRYIHKDGSTKWIRCRGLAIRDANGKPIRMLGAHQDISEIKNSETALLNAKKIAEESESKLRAALESMSDAVFISDTDGNFLDFNDAFATFHKFKNKQECAKTFKEYPLFLDVYFPNGALAPIEQWVVPSALRGEMGINKEFTLLRRDTNETWIGSYNYAPIRNNEGHIIGSVVTCRDITDSKKAQFELIASKEKAEESEGRFNLAMKASNDGLFDWNLETNEIYYSPGWKKMLGYEDHELPNDFSVWENTTDAEDVKKSWDLQQKLITKQIDRFVMEFKMKHKDGHWVDILSRAEAIFNEEGKAVRIVGTHTDITERKQTVMQLAQLHHQHKLVLDSAAEGILGLDLQGNHTFINRAAARILGYEAEELLGTPSHIMWHHTKPDGSPFPEEECAILVTLREGTSCHNYNEVFWRKDGTIVPVEYASTPIYEKGQLAGAVITFTDITERKQAENALLAKMNELERFHKLTVGREINMVELKKEVNNLLKKLGEDPKYKIVE